ncbi:MAG TPA: hypothetical protein VFU10_09935 [Gaiellaceae bacterium]|nr:hypothetical protein [Gaiellaceae bacterium]
MTRGLVVVVVVALVAAGNAGGGRSGFGARVTNPWFPLRPGTTYVSTGVKDGKAARDVTHVTARVTTIAGAPGAVVEDRLFLDGMLEERTIDWYAQDAHGTVWYFGEQTAELDRHGHVTTTEGSWQAGVNGARPGVFMPAHPRVGMSFRQEFAKGLAADHFRVRARIDDRVLQTVEWTPLEPGVLDHKTYAFGVGTVFELTVKGGNERLELISMSRR